MNITILKYYRKENDLPILELHNVACKYKQKGNLLSLKKKYFWALKDVSFNLYDGEALGIIGRNGAGKTTLLRIIAGIIAPDKGIVRTSAKSISLLSLQVGFVPHLTGRKNIILSGMMLGLTYNEIEERMQSIIDFSEVKEFIDQPVAVYSTGMRARLGFSTAFFTDPDIVLIDETLGVGDAEFRKKSASAMREKIQSNKTVVLVSHNANLIRKLCSRSVWIEGGYAKAEGDTEKVISLYENILIK